MQFRRLASGLARGWCGSRRRAACRSARGRAWACWQPGPAGRCWPAAWYCGCATP